MNDSNSKKILKIQEVIKILQASESFLKHTIISNDNRMIFLNKFISILRPYRNMDADKFLIDLSKTLETNKKSSKTFKPSLKIEDVTQISLMEVKKIVKNQNLKKDDLLLIAESTLHIPMGSIRALKKELIKQKILNMIDNIEKLDTIKKQAKI